MNLRLVIDQGLGLGDLYSQCEHTLVRGIYVLSYMYYTAALPALHHYASLL